MSQKQIRNTIVVSIFLILLFVIQVIATYQYLIIPSDIGFNDFFSRWRGANIYLLEGRDPYGLDVTSQIQVEMGATYQAEGRSGFHYPLHVLFLFWPLVYLPYTWTQAIWFTILLWLAIATVGIMLIYLGWKPSLLGVVGLLLGTIIFYPIARTMLLGQFTIHVTFFIALCLLLLQKEHDGWAGIALAATSVKPQLAVFVGVWLVLWALFQKRYRFIWGVLGGGLLFFLASTAVYSRWIISFIEDMQRYADVAGGRNPLLVMTELLGLGETQILHYILSTLLLSIMLYSWWRARHDDGILFNLAVYWSLLVTAIVPFQTGTTNQAVLLIPLLAGIYYLTKRWGGWKTAVLSILIIASLWVLFGVTISGNYENQILFLPLPFLVLIGLVVAEWQLYQSKHSVSQPAA